MSGRRWANVTINETVLAPLLRGRRDAALTSDWPEDAVIVNGTWDRTRAVFVLTVESAIFDEVAVGMTIPDWNPTFTAWMVEPSAMQLMTLIDRMQQEELDEAAARA